MNNYEIPTTTLSLETVHDLMDDEKITLSADGHYFERHIQLGDTNILVKARTRVRLNGPDKVDTPFFWYADLSGALLEELGLNPEQGTAYLMPLQAEDTIGENWLKHFLCCDFSEADYALIAVVWPVDRPLPESSTEAENDAMGAIYYYGYHHFDDPGSTGGAALWLLPKDVLSAGTKGEMTTQETLSNWFIISAWRKYDLELSFYKEQIAQLLDSCPSSAEVYQLGERRLICKDDPDGQIDLHDSVWYNLNGLRDVAEFIKDVRLQPLRQALSPIFGDDFRPRPGFGGVIILSSSRPMAEDVDGTNPEAEADDGTDKEE